MANAKLDENGAQTMIALLNTNGSTITRACADPTDHSLCVSNGTTGSDNGGNAAEIDDNFRTCLYALSSADGVTRVALYVDSSGKLLIDSS